MRWILFGIVVSLVVNLIGSCATLRKNHLDNKWEIDELYRFSTDVYDEQIEKQDVHLENIRYFQKKAQQNQQELVQENAEKQRQKEALETQVNHLEQETERLLVEIVKIKAINADINTQKIQLDERAKQLKVDLNQLKQQVAIQPQALTIHRQQATQLANEVNKLWKILRSL